MGISFEPDGEESGLLDSSDAIATTFGTSALVADCMIFPEASNDCGILNPRLIQLMGGEGDQRELQDSFPHQLPRI